MFLHPFSGGHSLASDCCSQLVPGHPVKLYSPGGAANTLLELCKLLRVLGLGRAHNSPAGSLGAGWSHHPLS